MTTTKEDELAIVEVRALRDLIEEMKRDIWQVHEFLKQSSGDSIDEAAMKLLEKYLPKGGTDVAQKNSAT
jgi:hypothetical protein